jgi:NADH-quinone oxidoreductase subunit A
VQFDFAMILVFVVASVGFAIANLVIGSLLRPRFPSAEKSLIYECGERPIGGAWFNFNPRFYIIALVFVIFEVEIALTIPVAVVFRSWVRQGMGMTALVEILAFVAILFSGLVWIWARRDLEWVKRLDSGELKQAEGAAGRGWQGTRSYVEN